MIRLQDNVPSVYVEQSRDFQLFCRLYDCIVNGVRYDISTMTNIFDANKINDQLLSLLSIRQGFFTDKNLNADVLRTILSAFPYIIKYKGSRKGIELCVNTILKLEGIYEVPRIDIDSENLVVTIYTESKISNTVGLDELLKYVLPVGYIYTLERYVWRNSDSELVAHGRVYTLVNPAISNSQVIGSDRFSNYVFDIGFKIQTADGTETEIWKHFLYSQEEYEILEAGTIVKYSINLNNLFNLSSLTGSTFTISMLGADCDLVDSNGESLTNNNLIKDTTSRDFIVESPTYIVTLHISNVRLQDKSAFGFKTRLERLYVGSIMATQVIGALDYLSASGEPSIKYESNNAIGVNRDMIDSSGSTISVEHFATNSIRENTTTTQINNFEG